MPHRVEFAVGKNKKLGVVGIKFSEARDEFIFPAANALELAKQLILAARECAEEEALRNIVREINKETER